MKKNKLVALCYNINGGCEYVALVKNVDESEYAQLVYEARQHEVANKKELQDLKNIISDLTDCIDKLEHEIKVLKGEEDYEESIKD